MPATAQKWVRYFFHYILYTPVFIAILSLALLIHGVAYLLLFSILSTIFFLLPAVLDGLNSIDKLYTYIITYTDVNYVVKDTVLITISNISSLLIIIALYNLVKKTKSKNAIIFSSIYSFLTYHSILVPYYIYVDIERIINTGFESPTKILQAAVVCTFTLMSTALLFKTLQTHHARGLWRIDPPQEAG